MTRSITRGQLGKPRIAAPSQQTALRNHPSWEKDEDAKRALCLSWQVYAAWADRMPDLLQPCGAVPKGTAPFYGPITYARFANLLYLDWEVTYTTAAQLSSTSETFTSPSTFQTRTTCRCGLAAGASCG